MTERRERIPADEVKEPKRWNLPYWTEPSHLVNSDEPVDEEEVLVEDEEIEVEPLTAEQLELIRQEAFNEGLEQGLIEGRQKGEKLGYDEGHQEGLEKGQIEGRKLGFDSGFEKGETQALTTGTQENEKNIENFKSILTAINQDLIKQKQELSENLPDIILAIAKAVITQELSQGSEHIVTLVQQALDSLPLDSGHLKIDVNPSDLPFIEAAIEQGEFEGEAHASEKIEAGGCRIHTRYSAVNFTLSERWKTIEKQYYRQLQLALNDDEESEDDEDTDDLDLMAMHAELEQEQEEKKQKNTEHKNKEVQGNKSEQNLEDDQVEDQEMGNKAGANINDDQTPTQADSEQIETHDTSEKNTIETQQDELPQEGPSQEGPSQEGPPQEEQSQEEQSASTDNPQEEDSQPVSDEQPSDSLDENNHPIKKPDETTEQEDDHES